MAGIIRNHGHRLVAIKAMPDHVHILIKFPTTQSISDLVQDIKGSTSKWINESGFIESRFPGKVDMGIFLWWEPAWRGIKNFEKQEEYHRNKTVREEYKEILEREGVTYEEKYLFEDVMWGKKRFMWSLQEQILFCLRFLDMRLLCSRDCLGLTAMGSHHDGQANPTPSGQTRYILCPFRTSCQVPLYRGCNMGLLRNLYFPSGQEEVSFGRVRTKPPSGLTRFMVPSGLYACLHVGFVICDCFAVAIVTIICYMK